MTLNWEDLRLFVAVVEGGSFSAAARSLGLGQATLSRRMAEFEDALGEQLFVRRTHGIELTAAGQRLLPAAQRMAEWAIEAAHDIAGAADRPEGRVRIAAPPGVAQDFLAPFAARLARDHAGIHLDVLSGIDVLNLARGEADLALRVMPPADGDLIVLDHIEGEIGVFAAPSYAATLGPKPALADLRWISWSAPWEHLRAHRALVEAIPGFAPAFASDDFNVQSAACMAGAGAMLEARIYHRYARVGQLVDLGIDLGPEAVGALYLICHRRQRQLAKVRVVVEAIREEFAWARARTAEVARAAGHGKD